MPDAPTAFSADRRIRRTRARQGDGVCLPTSRTRLLTPLTDPRFTHQSNRAALSPPPDERPPHRWRGAGSPGSPSASDVAMIYRDADAFAAQIFAVKEIAALLAPGALRIEGMEQMEIYGRSFPWVTYGGNRNFLRQKVHKPRALELISHFQL